ncbi:MAG: MFS transporter [Chloroflexota bacterium]|nr:MFS transporter [Chloroflexota bacterium]
MARFSWGNPFTSSHPAPTDQSAGSSPLPDESAARTAHRPDSGQDAVGTKVQRPGRPPINWRTNLYALFLSQLLAIVAFSLRAPFLPFFLGDLGLESTEQQAIWSGMINAFGAGTMAITAPIWGIMADRYGRKPMLLRAQFAAFITIGLMGLATEPWHLLGLRMVEGMFTGTVTAATALVATSMPRERLGFGLGLIQTAVFSGSALGPLVGGILADQAGYRATFGIASGMMLSGGLVTLFLVKENFTPQSKSARVKAGGTSWRILLMPVLLGLTLVVISVRFASSAVQPIMPLFVEELAGNLTSASSSLAGVTLGVLGVTSAISSVYFGRLGDRKGHRAILLWCMLGSGLVYLPMALSQHPWHLIALQAVFGVFAGGTIPAANAMIATVTDPQRRGAIFGLMASAAAIGGFIGPLAGAGLAASIGFRATFVFCGVVLLATVAVVLWTERHQRDREQPETVSTA